MAAAADLQAPTGNISQSGPLGRDPTTPPPVVFDAPAVPRANRRALRQVPAAPAKHFLNVTPGPQRVSAANVPYPTYGLGVDGVSAPQTGVNVAMPGDGWCGIPAADYNSVIDSVANNGLNMARVWFYQSAGMPGIDAAIAHAKARNVKLVAVMGNMWGDCEPPVLGQPNVKTLPWYQNGYKVAGDGYPLSFRDWAATLAQRYGSEDTIGIWQLTNEGDARNVDSSCNDAAATVAMQSFAGDMVQTLRSNGAQQLIALGAQAPDNCGLKGDNWFVAQRPFNLCTVNQYQASAGLMASRVQGCALQGKPTLIVEVGLCSNVAGTANTVSEMPCGGVANLPARAVTLANVWRQSAQVGASGSLLWHGLPAIPSFGDPMAVLPTDPALQAYKQVNDVLGGAG